MSEKDDEWATMHAMRCSHMKPGERCKKTCADPVCQYGCLNVITSSELRQYIILGVRTLREEGDSELYPYKPTQHIATMDEECRWAKCADPVCQITGCLRVPGWQHRKIIEAGIREMDNELVRMLDEE